MGKGPLWQTEAFRRLGPVATILAQTLTNNCRLKGLCCGFKIPDLFHCGQINGISVSDIPWCDGPTI